MYKNVKKNGYRKFDHRATSKEQTETIAEWKNNENFKRKAYTHGRC